MPRTGILLIAVGDSGPARALHVNEATDPQSSPPDAMVKRSRRKQRIPWIGPLFYWELTRLARKGQNARTRSILCMVLLITLCVFTLIWFPNTDLYGLFFGTQQNLDIKETSRFAEQFALVMLLAQMAVMVLITPAYAAGAIAEEKDRKTLQNLLTTELSNREIILGKFLGRMLFLLGTLLAGLPVLALTGLIGGVDALFLVLCYGLTATTVIMLGGFSLTAAVYASTFRGAMFRSYGLTALYVLFGCGIYPLLSPFAVLSIFHVSRADMGEAGFVMLGAYMLSQVIIAGIFLRFAIKKIRKREMKEPDLFSRDMGDKRSRRQVQRARRVQPTDANPGEPASDLPTAKPLKARRVSATPDAPPSAVLDLDDLVDEPAATPARKKYRKVDESEDPDGPYRPRHRTVPRPRVSDTAPFYWKEKYTLGTRYNADEESIRNLMVIVGIIAMVMILFFSAVSLLAGLLDGSTSGMAAASRSLLMTGSAGMFVHLLTMGSAACQTVLRERQRVTLESLLTIPVDRREILGPKWLVCWSRGWWWGGAGLLAIFLGIAMSSIPWLFLPMIIYLPALTALAVSFGIWLSIRSHSTARAVMWYMPVIVGLLFVPFSLIWFFDAASSTLAVIIGSAATCVVLGAAYVFWRRACQDFEQYGR